MRLLPIAGLVLLAAFSRAGVLKVTSGYFSINGQKVFLSGPNIAWQSYGYDFGNGMYDVNGGTLESLLQSVSDSGGNAVRIWIHVEGDNTPQWNSDGFVTGLDNTGTMINDLKRFLDAAQARDIVVIPVLWNAALMRNQNVINLAWDDAKLQSYIDNALIPMVSGLAGHPAIGAWEVMNEPEGSIIPGSHPDPCADTSALAGDGPGWSGANIPMERMLKFLNWQLAAIRDSDPSALRSVSTWSELSGSDTLGRKNYYTDECLERIGGKPGGTVDFYQIHTYSHNGAFNPTSPFKHSGSEFGLNKPLLIGEFSSICGENWSMADLFDHLYYNGYNGGLTWMYSAVTDCGDSQQVQNDGYQHIRNYNDPNNGGLVEFDY
ncbi:Hypothetical predicted protein [Cloeon dipterum]|uniref:Glycoside hydrolase family 5 domain-containing protein n=1 Tax=Cloeon dipterum TaxID=197152 RepID=A0A8S1DK75_9INSE|nr:Hypothetical predicted protein [Cloeon dipterum]